MKPSEFLSEMDGHGIYSAEKLGELDAEYRDAVPTYSHQQTFAAIEARGLGGELAPDNGVKLIYGYTTAAALARLLLDEAPSNSLFGRGSGFRADLAALRAAGY
jgi:hypothetical protein